jgi:hypothetical protein
MRAAAHSEAVESVQARVVREMCERNGTAPHRYKRGETVAWRPLLGLHNLCAVCGLPRIFVGHERAKSRR